MDQQPSNEMDEGPFKTPALPCARTVQKRLRTMEWLQMDFEDVNQFGSDTNPLHSTTASHITDTVEVDFNELHKRSLSTSTPFVPRTSAITSIGGDSGIDTFSLSLQSNLLTSSACHSTDDSCPHNNDGLSMEYEGNVLISSKCSDADSAFGDASLASHDLSQDSQASECFSLDMHPESFHDEGTKRNYVPPCIKVSSGVMDNKNDNSERECHVLTSEIQDTSVFTNFVSNTSSTNLSLPAPSWCSPVTTPGIMVKPSCTSTPKDSLQENINEMVKHFSPSEPDRLIGRKMGLDCVDVVSELHMRSVCSLQAVFRYLESEDLCRCCMVNRQWKLAIHSDPSALKRKKFFLRSQKLPCQKENRSHKGKKPVRGLTCGASRLGAIQAIAEKTVPLAECALMPSISRHKLFWEEAKKCKEGESIRKCPRCSSPARVHDVQERAWCSSEKCKFDFCIKCNLPFHGAKDCALPSPTKNTKKTKKDNIIGSKTSKKKLRRL